MVAGHLREQNGNYQIILSWKGSDGKRKGKSISTGLPVKGNKKRAEALLLKARKEFDPENHFDNAGMQFSEFLAKWLKDRGSLLSPDLYASHAYNVRSHLIPYFEEHPCNILKLGTAELESFYLHQRKENKVHTHALLQIHETILVVLSYGVELGWIQDNTAEGVSPCSNEAQILFSDYLRNWLRMMQTTVKRTTYAGYAKSINGKIIPYFDARHPGLRLSEVTTKHIQDYYTYEMLENGLSANTIKHRHANIRKALQYAYTTDLIPSNPAVKVTLPKIEKYSGNYYNAKQLEAMFQLFKGDPAEFGVITASYYGLRRSEILGLRWDAIDFDQKTITIRHTVTDANVDGKLELVISDSTKTKSSYRTLPLVAPFEAILLKMKAEQDINRELCGRSYCQDYLGYIYVNQIGELVKPGYLTAHVPAVLKKNDMPKIRFHDLRHSCASLLFAQGVPMKDIQAWLGHSTIGTTANIYMHMDENKKTNSANAIISILPSI